MGFENVLNESSNAKGSFFENAGLMSHLNAGVWLQQIPPVMPDVTFVIACRKVATFLTLAFVLYIMGVIVYRLYFSPIAKFPRRFLARVTNYYEFYYNVIGKGRYWVKIDEMHKKYGMVVSRLVGGPCCHSTL
jgi:hypothetical protein